MTLYEYVSKNKRYELLLEWDRSANKGIDPAKIPPSSRQSVSWICENGHHWNATVQSRTHQKTGCPYCSGLKIIPGETDLATLRPDLTKLWHPSGNGKLTPRDVTLSSHKNVWWRCEHGHDWQALVYTVTAGSGCPYCSGRRPIQGETDLATTNPELVSEWDYEKNIVSPQEVSRGSMKKVSWKCALGHKYEQMVYARVAGNGCPYCAGKKVMAGFNDLATTDPKILVDWDYEKNSIKPTEINRGSHKKVWWKCELGHSYEAAPYTHVAGSGCPYCSGRKVLAGFNDLATTNPLIAAQWDLELNGDLTPQMVTKGSNKKVWWRCTEGHVWQAVVFSRTRKKASDCPVCAGTVRIRHRHHYNLDNLEGIIKIDNNRTNKVTVTSSVAI